MLNLTIIVVASVTASYSAYRFFQSWKQIRAEKEAVYDSFDRGLDFLKSAL